MPVWCNRSCCCSIRRQRGFALLSSAPQFGSTRTCQRLAETAYTVLRNELRLEALAHSGSGPREDVVWPLLGFAGARTLLPAGPESCRETVAGGMRGRARRRPAARHRHNVSRLAGPGPAGATGCAVRRPWPPGLLQPAPLDLRVDLLTAKREAVAKALAEAGIRTHPRVLPLGAARADKPALHQAGRLSARRGEVQVRVRNCWHCCSMLKRGEMGGGLLRWCRRQNSGDWRADAQHRASVRVRCVGTPPGSA